MSVVLLLCGIVAFVGAVFNLRRSLRLARALCPLSRTVPRRRPTPVSILAPCRGVDDQFVAYARTLLAQQYSGYEVLFLVESTSDPAWHVLNRILTAVPSARASLIITGTAEGCSQKIHNLLVGLEHVAPETSILTFVDSDVQVHPYWLEALVTPLDDATVGATSGLSLVCTAPRKCGRKSALGLERCHPHPHGSPTVWICLGWIDGYPA